MGIKKKQSVAAPLASDFCKSDHLQLCISHVLAFQCCQFFSKKTAVTMALNIGKKTPRLSELAEVCQTRHA